MKTIYLVRHGESEANVKMEGAYKDDRDYRLTDKGTEQSRFIAERARHLKFDALIASPYVRTRDTAALITEATGKLPVFSDLFIERVAPSGIAGNPVDDPETQRTIQAWVETFYTNDERIGDGENFADITKRAADALRYLSERSEDSILVVTHGLFLRVIIATVIFGDELTPRELRHIIAATKTTNTGITVLTYDKQFHQHDVDPDRPRWRIHVYNDHAHLA